MKNYSVGKDFSIKRNKNSSNDRTQRKEDIMLLAKYSSMGYYLITPLLLGVFIGFGLDTFFTTKPFFIVSGIVFGSISTFYNLFKLIKEN